MRLPSSERARWALAARDGRSVRVWWLERGPLVVRGRRPEDDALELGRRGAAEAQRGLEAVGAQLAGIESAAQLVQRAPVLVRDLVARGLQQDQVARAPEAVSHADEALALGGVESL